MSCYRQQERQQEQNEDDEVLQSSFDDLSARLDMDYVPRFAIPQAFEEPTKGRRTEEACFKKESRPSPDPLLQSLIPKSSAFSESISHSSRG